MKIIVLLALLISSPAHATKVEVRKEDCKTSGYCCAYVFGKGYKCQYHVMKRCKGEKEVTFEDGRKVKETQCKKK